MRVEIAAVLIAVLAASTRPVGEPPVEEDAAEQRPVEQPAPLSLLPEIDELGNVTIATEVDAVVIHDGGPDGPVIAGMDIRGSRCSRTVFSVWARSPDGPWTVICLPREFGLYERINGREPPGAP